MVTNKQKMQVLAGVFGTLASVGVGNAQLLYMQDDSPPPGGQPARAVRQQPQMVEVADPAPAIQRTGDQTIWAVVPYSGFGSGISLETALKRVVRHMSTYVDEPPKIAWGRGVDVQRLVSWRTRGGSTADALNEMLISAKYGARMEGNKLLVYSLRQGAVPGLVGYTKGLASSQTSAVPTGKFLPHPNDKTVSELFATWGKSFGFTPDWQVGTDYPITYALRDELARVTTQKEALAALSRSLPVTLTLTAKDDLLTITRDTRSKRVSVQPEETQAQRPVAAATMQPVAKPVTPPPPAPTIAQPGRLVGLMEDTTSLVLTKGMNLDAVLASYAQQNGFVFDWQPGYHIVVGAEERFSNGDFKKTMNEVLTKYRIRAYLRGNRIVVD